MKKEKVEGVIPEVAKRTPRNGESILKGALKLNLADRVELKKQLETSIAAEVKQMQELIESATK